MQKTFAVVVFGILGIFGILAFAAQPPAPATHVPIQRFADAAMPDERVARPALEAIRAGWQPGYASLIIEFVRFMRAPRPGSATDAGDTATEATDENSERRPGVVAPPLGDRGAPERRRLLQFLSAQTGQRLGDDINRWRQWLWQQPYLPHPEYAAVKRALYGTVDPRMRVFFPDEVKSTIRFDEIDWGGVRTNGIPPLRQPATLAAADARYLGDNNIVFGLTINGVSRAYPKRILGWHEMAIDRIGGVDLTIVYCTLCGTVMPFESEAGGRLHRFGTSGLLYQSNKLMFDEDTNSLWSTFEGRPVVGTLVGSNLSLRTRPVVTTTWKAWRTAHPDTTVLSLDTGHQRDYSEGAAYRDYFATDNLMFEVSRRDTRLRNKDEVLVMRLPGTSPGALVPVAVDVRALRRRPVYTFTVGQSQYVVITDASGANRVYARTTDAAFDEQRAGETIVDRGGERWRATEDALIAERAPRREWPRVPAQRAFWFGWFAQFPDTILLP